ncbi:MAG: hypothetical protein RL501_975 [Bacteroidota bacterium]|jgi:RND family efflux transporter MFP subunit
MKRIAIPALLGVFLLSACSSEQPKSTEQLPAISVTLAQADASAAAGIITGSGIVEAAQSANLSTRMMGYIAQYHVAVGDRVTQGQLLVEVNPSDMAAKTAQAKAGVAQAQAGYDNAKKDYERFKHLFAQNSASQKELDDMTTRFQMAEAGLSAAQNMLKEVEAHMAYALIRAPFSGVVVNTFGKPGDMATPGMPLVALEGGSGFEVKAWVSETNIAKIQTDTQAHVVVKSQGLRLPATITEVSTSAKNTGGQYLVKLQLSETDAAVRAGMFVQVLFEGTTAEETPASGVLVETAALVKQGQLTGVYTTAQGKALLRWVRIGASNDGMTAVISGLSAGESYVRTSASPLYDGAPVSIN